MNVKDIKYRKSNYYADAIDVESLLLQNNGASDNLSSTGIATENISESKKPQRRWMLWLSIAFMVTLWYSFAVMTITTSKVVMLRFQFPYLLCCTQFTIATILTRIYLHFTNSFKAVQPAFADPVLQIAVSYTLGFIFTNLAFSLVNANFAETIKAAEPLSTVVLGLILLREQHSFWTYLTLIPICSGVAISCFHDDSFHLYGFIYSLISNFCFSTRAVVAKKLNLYHAGLMDEISLFYHISSIGLLLLIPLMLWMEGSSVLHKVNHSSSTDILEIAVLVIVNGIGYTVYNVTSFLVLSRTNLITHAVLNVFRRVFIILFTAFFFNVLMGWFNLLGIFIAVAGVLSFAISRSRDSGK